MRRRLSRPVGALAAGVLLAGCSVGASDVPTPDGAAPGSASALPDALSGEDPALERYVALGDSFTAAPFVPTTDLAEGCFRSSGNYPALLAERLDVTELVDVSCSGADTRDVLRPQQTVAGGRVPAQIDAVTEDTDLVTVGIGGNDFDLFTTLVRTCVRLSRSDPSGSPCQDRLAAQGVDLAERTARIGDRVARVLRRVQQRAPEAEVVLVGYPRLAPERGSCPARLPFADGDYAQAREVSQSLNDALRAAADRTGARFVDLYAASSGHDICSDEPWVNGRRTDRAAALAFHPYPAGMAAAAERVEDALT